MTLSANKKVNGSQLFFPQFRRKLAKLVLCGLPPLFILFQLFRLTCLVMFAIFVVDCTLYHGSTSVDCKNFSVYSVPGCNEYCWKSTWLVCSILTSTICICVLNRSLLPDLRPVGYTAVWRCLVRKPYFWSLNITAALAILYDVLIMIHNQDAKIPIECLVVASKLWTLYLIYQLNFTYPPSRGKNFRPISRAAYCITLSIFALDNLCKLLVVSAQVAFKFYTVNRTAPEPVTIIDLMLMITNGSLYHSFLQFFWQKLFRGGKDILTVVRQNFAETSGIREHIHPDDDAV